MNFLFRIILTLIFYSNAKAAVIDINSFYLSDGMTSSTTNAVGKTFYSALIGFNIDKKGLFQLGWNYASYSTSDTVASGTPVTYVSTQMGPALVLYLNKDRNWRFGLAYNLTTKALSNATGASEEWRGTGIAGDLGYQIPVNETFSFGFRLNYSTTSFTEQVISTTITKINYKRTFIYPSISLAYEF